MRACDCRWDVKKNKRVYCSFHQLKRQDKQPKRPILYASSPDSIYQTGQKIEDSYTQALFYFIYLTGGRINEVTDFSPNRIQANSGHVAIRLKTLKQRKLSNSTRTIIVPLGPGALCHENEMWGAISKFLSGEEPFNKPFRKWPSNMSAYLRDHVTITAEAKVLNKATNEWEDRLLEKKCHPHWLRHCRATHLNQFYHFDDMDLCKFFGWTDHNMPLIYTKERDLLAVFQRRGAVTS